jgi:hypothetical protein
MLEEMFEYFEKVEIIEVWGIGKREREEIYRKITKRLIDNG